MPPTSVEEADGQEQASSDMARSYLATSEKNKTAILHGCGDNSELQSILFNLIKEFHEQTGSQKRSVGFLV